MDIDKIKEFISAAISGAISEADAIEEFSEIASVVATAREEIERLSSIIKESNSVVEELNSRLVSEGEKVAEFETQVASLTTKISEDSVLFSAAQDSITSFEATIIEKDALLQTVQVENASNITIIDSLNSKITELTATVATLEEAAKLQLRESTLIDNGVRVSGETAAVQLESIRNMTEDQFVAYVAELVAVKATASVVVNPLAGLNIEGAGSNTASKYRELGKALAERSNKRLNKKNKKEA